MSVAGALGGIHPECVSHGPECGLFKSATKHGGARPGSGPKRKSAHVPPFYSPDPRWYCATVRPGYELIAHRRLCMAGHDAFVPILLAIDTPRHVVRAPLFPGYLFIAFPTDTTSGQPSGWGAVTADEGVGSRSYQVDLLRRTDGTPHPMPAGIVEDLMARSEGGAITLPSARASILAAGDVMRVADGPFTGFDATVLTASRDWVTVLLTVFGQATKARLRRDQVEA